MRDPVEALQWLVDQRTLVLGWGFWLRAERAQYRRQAELLEAAVRLVFLDAPLDVLWARVGGRPESASGTLAISRAELEQWATWFEPPGEDELP